MKAYLKSLHIYPVKSCHRVDLDAAELEPWGLAGDRRWLITDPEGRQRTQRVLPRMALIQPSYGVDGRLRLQAPGMTPDHLELAPPRRREGAEEADVTVWRFTGPAARAGDEADEWLSTFLGEPSMLVHMDDTSVRPTNPKYSRAQDRVSFADGYPLLLTSTASLAVLDDWIAEMGGDRVPMTRFRPNVVVEGTEPWAEDGWRRVRIGGQVFRMVKRCGRCVMTTVDAERGMFAGQQPLRALRKHRREDKEVFFGVNLIPDTVGSIKVGEDFEVLE
jgi:uncharacterized protein YcbX